MALQDFDARSVQPRQGGSAHPPGMHDFQITSTHLQENKDKTGAMLVVEMTSPVGVIENRYNVINPSADAMRIANEQLSALCYAVNIFQVAFPKNPDGSPVMEMAGHTLRGGRGRMEIVPQLVNGQPNGYMKVNKVFDAQGNEPGKAPSGPMVQGAGGNWSNGQQQNTQQNTAQQPQQQQPQQNSGWGGGNQQQPQQQQPNNPAPGGKPSWAS